MKLSIREINVGPLLVCPFAIVSSPRQLSCFMQDQMRSSPHASETRTEATAGYHPFRETRELLNVDGSETEEIIIIEWGEGNPEVRSKVSHPSKPLGDGMRLWCSLEYLLVG